jgi:hypothetical protein
VRPCPHLRSRTGRGRAPPRPTLARLPAEAGPACGRAAAAASRDGRQDLRGTRGAGGTAAAFARLDRCRCGGDSDLHRPVRGREIHDAIALRSGVEASFDGLTPPSRGTDAPLSRARSPCGAPASAAASWPCHRHLGDVARPRGNVPFKAFSVHADVRLPIPFVRRNVWILLSLEGITDVHVGRPVAATVDLCVRAPWPNAQPRLRDAGTARGRRRYASTCSAPASSPSGQQFRLPVQRFSPACAMAPS